MSDLRQAAMLALDALENHAAIKHPQQIHYRDAAIEALRDALYPQTFHSWWNAGNLTKDNSYKKDTPAYWAWEGWHAAILLTTSPSQIAHSDACVEKEQE